MLRTPADSARTIALAAAAVYAAALLAALAAPALAADGDTTVTISWGLWLAELLAPAGTILLALLGALWALARSVLPGWLGTLANPLVERAIRASVDYALNAVDGAAKGRVLEVDVGNRVLAEALRRIEAQGDKVAERLGGRPEIARRIIEFLDLEPDAAVEDDPELGPRIVQRGRQRGRPRA